MLQATSPPPPSRCLTEVAVVLSPLPPLLVKLPLTRHQPVMMMAMNNVDHLEC